MFVQLIRLPTIKLFEGVAFTKESRFVLNVSVSGTVSNAMLPELDATTVNWTSSPMFGWSDGGSIHFTSR